MKKQIIISIGLLAMILTPMAQYAQCEKVASSCSAELFGFLEDGQYYGAEIAEGGLLEINMTFFAGYTYRLVACMGDDADGQIDYVMTDSRNRRIFSNEHLPDGKGWDFKVKATDTYTINARISGQETGCVVFEVGYKDDEEEDDYEELLSFGNSVTQSDADLDAWKQIDKDFNLDDLDAMDFDE